MGEAGQAGSVVPGQFAKQEGQAYLQQGGVQARVKWSVKILGVKLGVKNSGKSEKRGKCCECIYIGLLEIKLH